MKDNERKYLNSKLSSPLNFLSPIKKRSFSGARIGSNDDLLESISLTSDTSSFAERHSVDRGMYMNYPSIALNRLNNVNNGEGKVKSKQKYHGEISKDAIVDDSITSKPYFYESRFCRGNWRSGLLFAFLLILLLNICMKFSWNDNSEYQPIMVNNLHDDDHHQHNGAL